MNRTKSCFRCILEHKKNMCIFEAQGGVLELGALLGVQACAECSGRSAAGCAWSCRWHEMCVCFKHDIHLFGWPKSLICPILHNKMLSKNMASNTAKENQIVLQMHSSAQKKHVHFPSTRWCAQARCAARGASLCRMFWPICCRLCVVMPMA